MNTLGKTLFLVQFAVLLAIEALFCFTPLGSIPIGPLVATLMMVPVIVTAIMLGTLAGTVMGFMAGLFSFLVWTFMPPAPPMAFLFTPFYSFGDFHGNFGSLLICFAPRTLAGTFTGLAYKGFMSLFKQKSIPSMSLAAVIGSVTNTVGVLGGIWAFFGKQYTALAGAAILAIIGATVLTNGLPEAAVNAVVAPAVCRPLKTVIKKI